MWLSCSLAEMLPYISHVLEQDFQKRHRVSHSRLPLPVGGKFFLKKETKKQTSSAQHNSIKVSCCGFWIKANCFCSGLNITPCWPHSVQNTNRKGCQHLKIMRFYTQIWIYLTIWNISFCHHLAFTYTWLWSPEGVATAPFISSLLHWFFLWFEKAQSTFQHNVLLFSRSLWNSFGKHCVAMTYHKLF